MLARISCRHKGIYSVQSSFSEWRLLASGTLFLSSVVTARWTIPRTFELFPSSGALVLFISSAWHHGQSPAGGSSPGPTLLLPCRSTGRPVAQLTAASPAWPPARRRVSARTRGTRESPGYCVHACVCMRVCEHEGAVPGERRRGQGLATCWASPGTWPFWTWPQWARGLFALMRVRGLEAHRFSVPLACARQRVFYLLCF